LFRTGAGTETPALATALENLANLQDARGHRDEAARLRSRSKAINEKIFGRYDRPVIPAALLPVWKRDL
jgi:hypothetical protein